MNPSPARGSGITTAVCGLGLLIIFVAAVLR